MVSSKSTGFDTDVKTKDKDMNQKQGIKWCAVYTRKSTDENLDSDLTSLDAQRESCKAFIKSRKAEG